MRIVAAGNLEHFQYGNVKSDFNLQNHMSVKLRLGISDFLMGI